MARVKIGNVYPTDEYLLERCAPAGFGLGVKNGHDCTDCNEAILNGTYYIYGESAINHPGNSMQYGCLDVKRRGNYITQIVHYDYYEAKRFSKDGGTTWGNWEWVNPPMALGVEYCTTERYMGKPVYTMLFDMGQLANNGENTAYYHVNSIVCAQKLVESCVVIVNSYGIEEESHDIKVLVIPESTVQYGYSGDKSAYTGRLFIKYTY